jgi:hypothetical protein
MIPLLLKSNAPFSKGSVGVDSSKWAFRFRHLSKFLVEATSSFLVGSRCGVETTTTVDPAPTATATLFAGVSGKSVLGFNGLLADS